MLVSGRPISSDGFGLNFCCLGQFGFGFGKFPLKIQKFSIFALRVKKISSGRVKDKLASYLLRVRFGSGQDPSLSLAHADGIRISTRQFEFYLQPKESSPFLLYPTTSYEKLDICFKKYFYSS